MQFPSQDGIKKQIPLYNLLIIKYLNQSDFFRDDQVLIIFMSGTELFLHFQP